ncbi:MAG: hypothetical protein JWO11_3917 [Nocardioides sp.]|nr:hypothetical protein [Nocardioides sp.]
MSHDNKEVRRASANYAGLFAHGKTPDPEVAEAARRNLATAKISKAIRDALAVTPTLHRAQVEYLTGLLSDAGDAG